MEKEDYDEPWWQQGQEPRRRVLPQAQQAMSNVKLQLTPFDGKCDSEEFLAWVKKADMIFDFYEYPDDMRLKLAVIDFVGYTMNWWEQCNPWIIGFNSKLS